MLSLCNSMVLKGVKRIEKKKKQGEEMIIEWTNERKIGEMRKGI